MKSECYLVIEGCIFELEVYPRGYGDGRHVYIAVGFQRKKLDALNLTNSDKFTCEIELLNSLGSNFNYRNIREYDYLGKLQTSTILETKFYKIEDLRT